MLHQNLEFKAHDFFGRGHYLLVVFSIPIAACVVSCTNPVLPHVSAVLLCTICPLHLYLKSMHYIPCHAAMSIFTSTGASLAEGYGSNPAGNCMGFARMALARDKRTVNPQAWQVYHRVIS